MLSDDFFIEICFQALQNFIVGIRFDLNFFLYISSIILPDLQVLAHEAELRFAYHLSTLCVARGFPVVGELAYPVLMGTVGFPGPGKKAKAGKLKMSVKAVLGSSLKNCFCRRFVFPRENSAKFFEIFEICIAGMIQEIMKNFCSMKKS